MLFELRFETYLSYCPSKNWPASPSRSLIEAEEWMKAIKTGFRSYVQGRSPYHVIAERMQRDASDSAVGAIFRSPVPPVLVPVPRHSLPPQEPYHWPGRELANALVAQGFGRKVLVLLERKTALVKASAGGRRNAFLHRDSLAVLERIPPRPPIILVDDIITSGSQMMGAALALAGAFPDVEDVRCFAAMRTISSLEQFERIRAPVAGVIAVRANGACLRRP
jgi:predicted amidophosphoribosyltransferase